jgi:uncharacterized protein (DUF1501 family)
MAAQTLQCQIVGSSPRGGGGRLADALASQGYQTESFSMSGMSVWPQGFDTNTQIIDKRAGAARIRQYDVIQPAIENISSHHYGNLYGEEYVQQLAEAAQSSERLGNLLDGVSLQTDYPAQTSLAKQLRQVARMMATRADRKVERDFFYVSLGGFDAHDNVAENLDSKFSDIDDALAGFVSELRAQGIFDSTVLAAESDFGRSLTSNGAGTDHGWAGNTFVIGGGLEGGRVYNDFPTSLLEGNDQDAGRGRLIPRYPWESMMVPIAEWAGLDASQQFSVFPNLQNFNSTHIIDGHMLFRQ